jgi:hypothetical protein
MTTASYDLTNAQLIRAVRKPGRVYMTVMTANDCARIPVDKSFLIDLLKDQPADEKADWQVFGNLGDGIFLDVA